MESLQYLIHLFNTGGLVMYPLLILSFMVVAIAIERFMYFKYNGRNSAVALHAVKELTKLNEWQEIGMVAREYNGAVGRIILAGLDNDSSESTMKNTFSEAVNFRKYMDYLSAAVTISPLLGLLGTVTGMIGSFSILDNGTGASAITGGVGEALIATVSGLLVAILDFAVYTYFSHQLDVLLIIVKAFE